MIPSLFRKKLQLRPPGADDVQFTVGLILRRKVLAIGAAVLGLFLFQFPHLYKLAAWYLIGGGAAVLLDLLIAAENRDAP